MRRQRQGTGEARFNYFILKIDIDMHASASTSMSYPAELSHPCVGGFVYQDAVAWCLPETSFAFDHDHCRLRPLDAYPRSRFERRVKSVSLATIPLHAPAHAPRQCPTSNYNYCFTMRPQTPSLFRRSTLRRSHVRGGVVGMCGGVCTLAVHRLPGVAGLDNLIMSSRTI